MWIALPTNGTGTITISSVTLTDENSTVTTQTDVFNNFTVELYTTPVAIGSPDATATQVGATDDVEFTGLEAGEYFIYILANTGGSPTNCVSELIPVTIDLNGTEPTAIPVVTENTFCDPATLANGTITITDGVTPLSTTNFTFTWFSVDGGTQTDITPVTNENNLSGLAPGDYVIEVLANDIAALNGLGRGCVTTVNATIIDNPDVISLTSTEVPDVTIDNCSPNNTTITVNDVILNGASDGTANYSFVLFDEDLNDLSGSLPFTGASVANVPVGTYFVQATSTSPVSGCSSNFHQVEVITNTSIPTATITQANADAFCDAASIWKW